MPRKDGLSGISEGLELSQIFLQREAEDAMLSTGVAKDPYDPQVNIANGHEKILALFGANRCLSFRSNIHMADGFLKPLLHVQEGDHVVAFDFETMSFADAEVREVIWNGPRSVYRYRHSEGVLECTRSHKVCAIDPRTNRPMWVRVGRAVKEHYPVVVSTKNGCPILSFLEHDGERGEWHDVTMDLRIDHKDHAFLCDGVVVSNSGKSHLGAYRIGWDATGLYPSWYRGPKTIRGIDAWVLGKTGEITRDSCQRKLFGVDPERPGWTDKPGLQAIINSKYIIGRPSRKSQPSGAFDTVRVKHVPSDTISTITFKAYEMERQSLAAWNGDRVWVDEECPKEILDELIARLMDNQGQLIITLCPLDGMTPTVNFLLTSPPDLVRVDRLTHAHAKHLPEKEREIIRRMYESDPAALAARTEGLATTNSGLIFPFPATDIIYDPAKINISPAWLYLGGMDVGYRHPTAAVALAWDRLSDTIYAYASYEQAERTYLYHHAQLQMWGINMSFMIDPASDQVSQADGTKILEKYWELAHGPGWEDIEEESRKYIRADNSFPTGMDAMWHRFQDRRLLIRKDLTNLLDQYRGYIWGPDGKRPAKETPLRKYDIITSLRYGTMGVPKYAHHLDVPPPWASGVEFDAIPEEKSWKPYRAGRE